MLASYQEHGVKSRSCAYILQLLVPRYKLSENEELKMADDVPVRFDAVVLDSLTKVDVSTVIEELRSLTSCRDVDDPILCVTILDANHDDLARHHSRLVHEITAAIGPVLVNIAFSSVGALVPKSFALKRLLDSKGVSKFVLLTIEDNVSPLIVALDTIFTSAYTAKVKLYSGGYVDVPSLLGGIVASTKAAIEEECSQFLTTFRNVPDESVEIVRSDSLCSKIFFHGFSTRRGGCSSYPPVASLNLLFRPEKRDSLLVVKENRRRLLSAVGAPPTHRLIFPKVAHSSSVWVVGEPEPAEYDAIVCDRPGLAIAAPAADCVTVILGDPRKLVFAAVHSGWKGTAGNIAGAATEAMIGRLGCNPEDIRAAIGPSIGPCCYEVGDDREEIFRKDPLLRNCIKVVEGKPKRHLDLQMAVGLQLEEAGVLSSHIDRGPSKLCTYCNKERFYSYRRDKTPFGTLVGFIGLR